MVTDGSAGTRRRQQPMKLLDGENAEPPSCPSAATPLSNTHSLIDTLTNRRPLVVPARMQPVVRRERFPMGEAARELRRRFFPEASLEDWSDWRWQLRKRIRTLAELERVFNLSDDERAAVSQHKGSLPVGITPYYASLFDRDDAMEGLRRTHIPVGTEYLRTPGEADDPLGEDHDAAVPGLVHRYPDRVLFLTTGTCSTPTSRRIPRSATCCCRAAIPSPSATTSSTICSGGYAPSSTWSSSGSAPRCRRCCPCA
jgi:hypothetical protein